MYWQRYRQVPFLQPWSILWYFCFFFFCQTTSKGTSSYFRYQKNALFCAIFLLTTGIHPSPLTMVVSNNQCRTTLKFIFLTLYTDMLRNGVKRKNFQNKTIWEFSKQDNTTDNLIPRWIQSIFNWLNGKCTRICIPFDMLAVN
jgi:hypothetical protein